MALLGKYCDRFYRDALIRRFIATDGVVLVGGRRKFRGSCTVWIGRGRYWEKRESWKRVWVWVLSEEECPGIERLTYGGSFGGGGKREDVTICARFWKRVCRLLKIIALKLEQSSKNNKFHIFCDYIYIIVLEQIFRYYRSVVVSEINKQRNICARINRYKINHLFSQWL